MGQVLTTENVMEMNCTKELFIQYGRFCERHGIKNYSDINNYEDYLNCNATNWEKYIDLNKQGKKCYIKIIIKQQIINFIEKLISNEYKVILIDGKSPILIDDDLEYYLYELLDDILYITRQGDELKVIHNDKTKIKLTGYKDMSGVEIFARQYLDTCQYGDLIVKDSLEQVEFRDDNFRHTKDLYNRCKDITNIRTVSEDNEHYSMNWDCIIVGYRKDNNYIEQIWQRC